MCSITAGLMGASALLGYQQQVKQAESQADAYRAQAAANEQNARIEGRKQEQIADNYAQEAKNLRSRQRLAEGAQRAQAGAAGVNFSGSQMDLLSSGLEAYGADQANLLSNQRNDNYNSRVTQTNYLNAASQNRAAADNVVSSAKGSLIPTLLSTAVSIAGLQGNTASSTVANTASTTSSNFGNATKNWLSDNVGNINLNSGKTNYSFNLNNNSGKNYWAFNKKQKSFW